MKHRNIYKFLLTAAFTVVLSAIHTTQVFADNTCLELVKITENAKNYLLDYKTPGCKEKIENLKNASVWVFGNFKDAKTLDDYLLTWVKNVNSDTDYSGRYLANSFSLELAKKFLIKEWLKSQVLRKIVKENIFMDVFGGKPSIPENNIVYIDIVKSYYQDGVYLGTQELYKKPTLRTEMINRAYQTMMGRDANAGDLQYWQSRTEIYKAILPAGREYLYSNSEAGMLELEATIKRFFEAKGKANPTSQQYKPIWEECKKNKYLYSEMLAKITL